MRPGTRRGAFALALCALALSNAGCTYGCGARDGFAPLTVFDNFRAIEAGLAYRSAQLDDTTLERVIRRHGIRTVINLRGPSAERWYRAEQAATSRAGVQLIDVSWEAEHLPPRSQLLRLYHAFQTAPHPILIHCKAGADRTGAAAAIWRMQVRGEPRAAAERELSLLYGHVSSAYPDMDRLVEMYQPDPHWIARQYIGPDDLHGAGPYTRGAPAPRPAGRARG